MYGRWKEKKEKGLDEKEEKKRDEATVEGGQEIEWENGWNA
jgi:hypothetical protein